MLKCAEIKQAINLPDGPQGLSDQVAKAAAEVAKKYAVGFLNYTMHRTGAPTEEAQKRIDKMLSDYDQWLTENGISKPE